VAAPRGVLVRIQSRAQLEFKSLESVDFKALSFVVSKVYRLFRFQTLFLIHRNAKKIASNFTKIPFYLTNILPSIKSVTVIV